MGKSMGMLKAVAIFLRAMLVPKARLSIENLALHQQLAVCRQSIKRPKLRAHDVLTDLRASDFLHCSHAEFRK
jgi:hypothetical protein